MKAKGLQRGGQRHGHVAGAEVALEGTEATGLKSRELQGRVQILSQTPFKRLLRPLGTSAKAFAA